MHKRKPASKREELAVSDTEKIIISVVDFGIVDRFTNLPPFFSLVEGKPLLPFVSASVLQTPRAPFQPSNWQTIVLASIRSLFQRKQWIRETFHLPPLPRNDFRGNRRSREPATLHKEEITRTLRRSCK